MMATDRPERGLTPNELAGLLRVSPDKVRAWINRGELKAVNTAATRSGKPRFVVLPEHLREFQEGRAVKPVKPAPRRKRQPAMVDYFPD